MFGRAATLTVVPSSPLTKLNEQREVMVRLRDSTHVAFSTVDLSLPIQSLSMHFGGVQTDIACSWPHNHWDPS